MIFLQKTAILFELFSLQKLKSLINTFLFRLTNSYTNLQYNIFPITLTT